MKCETQTFCVERRPKVAINGHITAGAEVWRLSSNHSGDPTILANASLVGRADVKTMDADDRTNRWISRNGTSGRIYGRMNGRTDGWKQPALQMDGLRHVRT